MSLSPTRRQFAALSAVAADAPAPQPAPQPLIRPGDTILFQGDSITDAGRKRDDRDVNSPPALGTGYAWLAAAGLLASRPDDNLKIFNRGNSGNKVIQLADRWQADCLDLKPNVLSILIGVNDFWQYHNGEYDGMVEKYQSDYAALIQRTRAALPDVRLVLCEPFVLPTGEVDSGWQPGFDKYRAAARAVAHEAGARFVPFHAMFDAASKLAPPQRWAADGVHPTPEGDALMAQAWLAAATP
jgi:lysophospholipase L1-like esterase